MYTRNLMWQIGYTNAGDRHHKHCLTWMAASGKRQGESAKKVGETEVEKYTINYKDKNRGQKQRRDKDKDNDKDRRHNNKKENEKGREGGMSARS